MHSVTHSPVYGSKTIQPPKHKCFEYQPKDDKTSPNVSACINPLGTNDEFTHNKLIMYTRKRVIDVGTG